MSTAIDNTTRKALAAAARPLAGAEDDYDSLMELVGDARFVLLGESTHGTHEFYEERASITRRLISEKGFQAVAVEADWPDAWRINRYVRGEAADSSATGDGGGNAAVNSGAARALDGFQRFPAWMWRNTDVLGFTEWLRASNAAKPAEQRVGFYGIDLYSMYNSIAEVLRYLDGVDPAAAREARERYACFDHYDDDSQAYGYAAEFGLSDSCRNGAVAQLVQLQRRFGDYASGAGDDFFYAQQNARLVINAEEYYRTMFRGRVSSWNLRDRHMADTLDALAAHLQSGRSEPAKIVVWAHNSHIGDARATESRRLGEWNVGQLMRERHGSDVRLIGFTTYDGVVTAASRWDGPAEHKRIVPALPGSHEHLLHEVLPTRFFLPLQSGSAAARAMDERRLERAIGVLYLPESERQSHYFHASMASQFDAIIHIDRTSALVPLETVARPGMEIAETFPAGV